MAQLIDSSVFITLERRRQPLEALLRVASPDEPSAIASVTASELLVGVHLADSDGRRLRREAFVESILDILPVIPFDLRAARLHSEIWSQLMGEGNLIGAHDLIIGAIALAHGYAVLTDNVREFDRIPDIEVRLPLW